MRLRRESGFTDLEAKQVRLKDELETFVDRIEESPPTTLAGAAVKARVRLRYVEREQGDWHGPLPRDGWSGDARLVAELCDDIIRLAAI